MEYLTPSHLREKSPFKDVTNSTPTPGIGAGSTRKITKSRHKRVDSITNTPQRRSTRLSSLRSEPQGKENKDEELQITSSTKQRRKVTPRSENITSRKRSAKKEESGMSVSGIRRTRTSVSTLPSSPLAGKASPLKLLASPKRLRRTRSNSVSTKGDNSPKILHNDDIPEISESALEDDEEQSLSAQIFDSSLRIDKNKSSPSHDPFIEYPLPLSPVKSIRRATALETPRQRSTPLPRHSAIKAVLQENDIFAISPGMFPRSIKRTDYLDLFADTHRAPFQSPVKIASSPLAAHVASNGVRESISNNIAIYEQQTRGEFVPIDALECAALNGEISNVESTEGDHPHFALLAYLAEVASVTEHLPEQTLEETLRQEEVVHGGIENILTAAALAESMKDELFMEMEDSMIPDEEIQPGDDELLHSETVPDAFVGADSMDGANVDAAEQEATHGIEDSLQISESEKRLEGPTVESSLSPSITPSHAELQEITETVSILAIENGVNNDDDWESLISFSEADETREFKMNTNAPDSNEMSLGQPAKAIVVEADAPDAITDADIMTCLDERGEFVSPKIAIFQDGTGQEDAVISRHRGRESLDNQVIFSLPTEKTLFGSPPKRQISSLDEQENFGMKKRKTETNLPNITRLDILRKRAMRVRSREARHKIKRRDFTTALQRVLDNLPSPPPKIAVLKHTPALIPPSLRAKRLQSPVTPAPTKRKRDGDTEGISIKSPSPIKPVIAQREALSPRKHIIIHPSPIKETPKPEFKFNFDKTEKTINEPLAKATPRYEVYSKIFGPPPQISKNLGDRDTTTTITQSLDSEFSRLKSPVRKHRVLDTDLRTRKKAEVETTSASVLGRPVRSETFAVPSLPVPPGPPQLPPSIQRHNNKRFTGVLPSPAQPPPSVIRSGLPRPAGFGNTSTAAAAATRRSTRVPKVTEPAKSIANVAVSGIPLQPVIVPEKKLNGYEVPSEKIAVPVAENIPAPENVTMERPKGKLGGAQRVTRNGDTKKNVEPKRAEVTTRPTRPPTPPLISLSQKELKALTENNTKKNEGFKTVSVQSTVKRVNKKRPGEPSDDFAVGKGAKWSKGEALPDWDRDIDDRGTVRWKSPRFMAKTERRGAIRVKGILKKKERERIEKEDELVGMQCEPLIVQRFVYKGEK